MQYRYNVLPAPSLLGQVYALAAIVALMLLGSMV